MPALLMDLDGTLADTLPHLFATFRHAVEHFVTRTPTDAEIVSTFGPPERDCILDLLYQCNDKRQTIVPDDLDRAVRRFHDYYEMRHDAVRVFPGIPDLVHFASTRHWQIGVQTGKSRRSAVFTLERLRLRREVECLITGDDVASPKPDPEGVRKALGEFGIEAGDLLVVGDTPADIQAGKAAGAKTAATLWGAFDREATRKAGAAWVLDKVDDLRTLIERWPG
jgi:phosphoglycolate phosphatase-like HAD superfamily hydrolase